MMYQGYSSGTTDEEAVAAFVEKYGVRPEKVVRNKGAVLVGPKPATIPQTRNVPQA